MICKTFSRSPMPAKLIGKAEIVRSTGMTAKKSSSGTRTPSAYAAKRKVVNVARCATIDAPNATSVARQ